MKFLFVVVALVSSFGVSHAREIGARGDVGQFLALELRVSISSASSRTAHARKVLTFVSRAIEKVADVADNTDR
ncbi:MAG: hypothetical protein DME01_00620 [Candidatus Rokuibacteriota bacterium]|nr:MAG: hypothetical protein DME01_00620 [Candidatus Rokubacteria bacterium]